MLEELWIVKISDEDLFEVGITFKGRTVLDTREKYLASLINTLKMQLRRLGGVSAASGLFC